MKKLIVWVILLCVSSGVMAQENITFGQRVDAPELAARGQYSVGVQTLELVNEGQLDVVNAADDGTIPTYDRPLTVEVWYPATLPADVIERTEYESMMPGRDPARPERTFDTFTLIGQAVRDADVDDSAAPYPLVIMSHGYPGNRYLLSHLGENLASKGYVVVSIDHTDSTYDTFNAFTSTLINRPLDVLFVLNEMAAFSADDESPLAGMIDADNTGLIGYSMGGYGAMILAGAGVSQNALGLYANVSGGQDTLKMHLAGSDTHEAVLDERIRAFVMFAPWGMNFGLWDADGMQNVTAPIFFVAGSDDDVSGYSPGIRTLFEDVVNSDRYILTFDNARHNAGAPIPPPVEATIYDEYMHFADSVWDTVRLNNIAQHFVTVFLGIHLQEANYGAYLDVVENAADGVYSVDDEGNFTDEHTYWAGFQDRSAIGLRLSHTEPE